MRLIAFFGCALGFLTALLVACSTEEPPRNGAQCSTGTVGVLDDLEDPGRSAGLWGVVQDGTAGATQTPSGAFAPESGGFQSERAAHTTGNGFTATGAGLYFNIESGNTCYDLAASEGIRFLARGTGPLTVSVLTRATVPVDNGGACSENCWNPHRFEVAIDANWVDVRIPWTLFAQGEGGTKPFNPSDAMQVRFTVGPATMPFDFWIDDVSVLGPVLKGEGTGQPPMDAGSGGTGPTDGGMSDVVEPPPLMGNGIQDFIDAALYEQMFPNRNALFSFDALVTAAVYFPEFCRVGDLLTREREAAAFLANIAHETTGGWDAAPGGPQAWGLVFVEEVACENNSCPPNMYCTSFPGYPCVEGKSYHGRGPMQLSWNFNYGPAGEAIGVDLLQNPELVASDAVISFKTALWFWMTERPNKPAPHQVMTGQWMPTADDLEKGRQPGFGMTINLINGGLECNMTSSPGADDRIAFYQRITQILGIDPGTNLDCTNMEPYL